MTATEVATLVIALGAGVVAGVFFAFSTFVMKALAMLPSAQGIRAVQAINVAAVSPAFMLVLFGTGAGAVWLVVAALVDLGGDDAALRLIAGLLYLLSPVCVTIAYHVPRNDRLAALDPDSAGAAEHWNGYVTGWTRMNHLRTLAPLATATLLTVVLTIR